VNRKQHFPLLFGFLAALLIFLSPRGASAEGEKAGQFEFSEFSLSPRASLREPGQNGFELKESWISFRWERDESLDAEIGLGSGDLIAPAIWFAPKAETVELTKAFVRARTPWMDVRAGILEIPFGYEGAFPEWEWMLPISHMRSSRWFIRRDYGIEFRTEHKPFLSTLTIHNGESATNTDGKMWVTGQWRILTSDGIGLLASGQVGNTRPDSTQGSLANSQEGFVFDPDQSAKIRQLSVALFRKWHRHLVLMEYGRGDILQNDDKNPFAWGHVDGSWNVKGDLSLLARYEQWQANLRDSSSVKRSYGAGVSVTSADRLSLVTLWLSKNQERPEVTNDEALILFRLNSNFL
jgi:hypothetical protein